MEERNAMTPPWFNHAIDIALHFTTRSHQQNTSSSSGKILNERAIEQEPEEIETLELTSPCCPDKCKRSKRTLAQCKNAVFMSTEKLDTGEFEQYSGKMWETFSEEKRISFACLDSLWFALYLIPSSKVKVLSWIKKKQILSKKYVFVPIVRWEHWSLLILCHFGESLHHGTSKPCMLLLDSLQMANPMRLEPDIRKFIWDIYQVEGVADATRKLIYRIPLLVPKVPQQRNDKECGRFVLYYMKLFVEGAPETFSISNGYPYCMNKNWFTVEELQQFFETFESSRKKSRKY